MKTELMIHDAPVGEKWIVPMYFISLLAGQFTVENLKLLSTILTICSSSLISLWYIVLLIQKISNHLRNRKTK